MEKFAFVVPFLILISFYSSAQEEFSLEEKVKSVIRGDVPLVTNESVVKWGNAVILDAREKEEYEISHLPKARYVGDKEFNLSKVSSIAKNDTIIVYCTVGYRSEGVGEKLIKAGYKNVFNLFGGISSWKNSGGKVFDASNKETDRVHAYNKAWSIFLLKGEKVY